LTRVPGKAPRRRFPFLILPEPPELSKSGSAEGRLDSRPEKPVQAEQPGASFFSGLLPIMDGLEAVRRLILDTGEEQWRRGISIFYEKLLAHLAAWGLESSARVGDPFDPALHEALAAAEARHVREGCVCEVVQQGWRFRGKVLRFARVVVARNDGTDDHESGQAGGNAGPTGRWRDTEEEIWKERHDGQDFRHRPGNDQL
jgi:hypothetical protein